MTRKEQAEALLREIVWNVAEATCESVAEALDHEGDLAAAFVFGLRESLPKSIAARTEGSADPDSPYARLLAMVGEDREPDAWIWAGDANDFLNSRISHTHIRRREGKNHIAVWFGAHPPAPSTEPGEALGGALERAALDELSKWSLSWQSGAIQEFAANVARRVATLFPGKSKDWPYTEVSSVPHSGCGGVVRYYEINSDHGDYRLRCDECGKVWVEEGPDA